MKGVAKLGNLASLAQLMSTSLKGIGMRCTPGFCVPEQIIAELVNEGPFIGLAKGGKPE